MDEKIKERKEIKPIEDWEILKNMPNEVIIKNHLIRYGSITVEEAKELYGYARCPCAINILRNKSEPRMVIDTVFEKGINKLGKKCRWGRYVFKGFKED